MGLSGLVVRKGRNEVLSIRTFVNFTVRLEPLFVDKDYISKLLITPTDMMVLERWPAAGVAYYLQIEP